MHILKLCTNIVFFFNTISIYMYYNISFEANLFFIEIGQLNMNCNQMYLECCTYRSGYFDREAKQ